MQRAWILVLILSVITPPGVRAAGEHRIATEATAAMGSPAGALCQLVRDVATTGKTLSGGWCAAHDGAPTAAVVVDGDHPMAHASLSRAFAGDCPPICPRPPPLS